MDGCLKPVKKTLKNQLQQSINTILSQQPEINLIKIADGAADNWRFLSDTLFPGKGVELTDYFHTSEPLNDAMEAAYGKGSATAIAKYQEYKSLLKNEIGGNEKVITFRWQTEPGMPRVTITAVSPCPICKKPRRIFNFPPGLFYIG